MSTIDKKRVGLYRKFDVRRTDGSDAPGGKHDGCNYFVLDVTHDPHAIPALRAYADACRADYPLLARDLDSLADGNDSQDWIDRIASDIRDLNPDYHDFEAEVAKAIRAAAPAAEGASLAALQQSFNCCELHTPDKWEGDGSCVICEGTAAAYDRDELTRRLAELTRELTEAKVRGDLFREQSVSAREQLQAAEATIARVRALSEKWRGAYTVALEYDKRHGLRDTTVELGGKAIAADEFDAALAAPAAGTPLANGDVEDWHRAAQILGEHLASIGQTGYYDFTPQQWLTWAKTQLRAAGTPEQAAPGSQGDRDNHTLVPLPGAAPFPPVQLQDGPSQFWTCPVCGKDALLCEHNRIPAQFCACSNTRPVETRCLYCGRSVRC